MIQMPNVWGTHSFARFRAIVFDAAIVVAVESAPAEWKANLLELGFCLHETCWYRVGALSQSEFEDLSPAITLVGFDYAYLCGGHRITEISPVSPILAHELQTLWSRNQDAVLLVLASHGVKTVWDADDCIAAAVAGDRTAPARALRKLAAHGLADRWQDQSFVDLVEGEHSSASSASKLLGITGEPFNRHPRSSGDQADLAAPVWHGDTAAWVLGAEGDLRRIPVLGHSQSADGTSRSPESSAGSRPPMPRTGGEVSELLSALSSMHYGGNGMALHFERGWLSLLFVGDEGLHQSLGIAEEIEGENKNALSTAAERLLETVTRRGTAVRCLAPLLESADGDDQKYLAGSLKSYRSVSVLRSLRETGRGASLSDYEIDQLLWMIAEPAHSLVSSAIPVADGLEVGWVEDAVLSSAAVRSYVRGELDDLQPTATELVYFSRSNVALRGVEGERVNYHKSLQALITHVREDLHAGGIDEEKVRAGLWRLGRIATLPRAEAALSAIRYAKRADLQRWVLAEIVSQLEDLPYHQGLDTMALADAATDAVHGQQAVLISVPLYSGAPELVRVPWTAASLIHQRSAALDTHLQVQGPVVRIQIDAFRYSDPSYREMLDSIGVEYCCGMESFTEAEVRKSALITHEDVPVSRADLWPRSDLQCLARLCSGLHRQFILGVWHGLPDGPLSTDRLAVSAYRAVVLGMRQACETSRRPLERACRRKLEDWLRDSVEQVCSGLVVSHYYTAHELYSSSLQWWPQPPASSSIWSLGADVARHDKPNRMEALLSVISHELLLSCSLCELSPATGLRAAAEFVVRCPETATIDWQWVWHVCETHILEGEDWHQLSTAMDMSHESGVGDFALNVRAWAVKRFADWATSPMTCPAQIPTTFFRVRRFAESIHALLSLGSPAVICMVIDRLQQTKGS